MEESINDEIIKDEISYEEKLRLVNAIAKPIAPKKLTKKIYKCIKKGKLFQLSLVLYREYIV